MKRFFKKTWIAILALATTVVAACSSSRHTNKQEDPNNQSINSDNNNVESDTLSAQRADVQARLDELRRVIQEREMSCIYGSPEMIQRYGAETQRLINEADSLQTLLDNGYGASNTKKKSELKKRLKELKAVIEDREMSDVYGSPEMIEEYQAETQQLRLEAAEIQRQIDAIEGKTPKNRKEIQQRLEEIETTLQETISARVYGSPEVLQRHHDRISTLEHERDSLRNELDALDDVEPIEIEE